MKRTLCFAALAAFILSLPAWGQEIRVTSPTAGARWCVGSPYTVTWTKSGTMDANVSIRLRLRGGGEEGAVTMTERTENDGSFGPWEVPAGTPPGEYLVRIRTLDGAVTGSSEYIDVANCTEPGATITVAAPDASSNWRPGSRQTIAWTRSGTLSPMASITLRREGAPEAEAAAARIADGCANNGSYAWLIPETLAAGRYFVRIRAGAVQGDSAVFVVGAEGRGSDLAGPLTPVRAELSMPGVGVEHYNGHIVAWVKNNGPDSLRDHDVTFRLNFPERGGGEQVITKRITVPIGAEEGVQLLEMSSEEIPDSGLRTSVSIDTALSHVADANPLNQHRDVRLCGLDIQCWMPSGEFEAEKIYMIPSKYRIRAHVHVRHNLEREVRDIRVICYAARDRSGTPLLRLPDGRIPLAIEFTIASLMPRQEVNRLVEQTYFSSGGFPPNLSDGTTYYFIAKIVDNENRFCDTHPGNDSDMRSFTTPD